MRGCGAAPARARLRRARVGAGVSGRLEALRPRRHHALAVRPIRRCSLRLTAAQRTSRSRLLLDYDGTLVPLARAPELAAPDDDLLRLLAPRWRRAGIQVDIVSGRPHETLERWFGDLPLALWAEHGFWRRRGAGANVDRGDRVRQTGWRVSGRSWTSSSPARRARRWRSKSASLAWHYRCAPREFGARQAHELRMLLGDVLSNQPLEVLEGKKVIEVRLRGVSKCGVAQQVEAELTPGTVVVAIGDDRTDEELFRALSPSSLTVAVDRACTGRPVSSRRLSRRTPTPRFFTRGAGCGGVAWRGPAATTIFAQGVARDVRRGGIEAWNSPIPASGYRL